MKTVRVKTSVEYDVYIGSGLIERVGEFTEQVCGKARICIITDNNVDAFYGAKATESFEKNGYDVEKIVLQHGEQSKCAENLFYIVNKLAEMHFTRKDILVALGGGVVGDLTGFCAATYMRGIRFIQVPTSLLAAVDSSVGGKTAVDLPAGKNLFGAFWQPSLVVCDVDTLDTLSPEFLADGTAEVIKYGMIWDKQLFDTVKSGLWDREQVICRCVEIKRDVVSEDEFDKGIRQILNFGHTFGHGIEALSNFTISHGFGVAIGMCMITRALVKQGEANEEVLNDLYSALSANNLPTKTSFDAEKLFEKVAGDKKREEDSINLILVKEIGKYAIAPTKLSQIKKMIEAGTD